MTKNDKLATRAKELFDKISKTEDRVQWEYINQKGYDFSNVPDCSGSINL